VQPGIDISALTHCHCRPAWKPWKSWTWTTYCTTWGDQTRQCGSCVGGSRVY